MAAPSRAVVASRPRSARMEYRRLGSIGLEGSTLCLERYAYDVIGRRQGGW